MIEIQGKKYLAEKESAKQIGMSQEWFRKIRQNKKGPPFVRFTENGKVFYEENELKKWISKRIINY